MRKTKGIKFADFMSGEYKKIEKERSSKKVKKVAKVALAAVVPIATGGAMGAIGLMAASATAVFAEAPSVPATVMAVPVDAKAWMGEQTLSALAHVLDPVVDVLVALSFPIASVIIVGACFFFMLGNSEKGWQTIQNAGLGYVLIQVSPLILNVLKQVGNAV
jgi:flagellar basal body-associated protein FliL